LSEGLGWDQCDVTEFHQLLEEQLEACRRDDLEYPDRFVTGIPERVSWVAGLEYQITRTRDQNLTAERGAHATLEDEAVFVLTRVPVQRRRERTRRHRRAKSHPRIPGPRS
jgi:hypothetical protein